jgi:hypothetical protein
MRWAIKRQLLYALGVLVILAILAVGLWYSFFYHKPTCADGIKNQNEEGIDCGGLCALLCQGPRISALWSRSVVVAPGVYHAVALVRNPEVSSGTASLPYTFQLFDDKNILVAQREGTMFLNPGEVAPVFEANIITGNRIPVRTFVSFGSATWVRMEAKKDPVSISSRELDEQALSLTAHVVNTTALPVEAIALTALLYDKDDVLVAASKTKIRALPARGETDAIFTWQQPFPGPIVRTEIVARIEK